MMSVPFSKMTREEKDEYAKKRMAEMKVKNEKFRQRYEEIEQDKKDAEEPSTTSQVNLPKETAVVNEVIIASSDISEKKVREWDRGKSAFNLEHWNNRKPLEYRNNSRADHDYPIGGDHWRNWKSRSSHRSGPNSYSAKGRGYHKHCESERSYPGQSFHNNSFSKPGYLVNVEDRKRGGINTSKIMHDKQSGKKVEDDGKWGDPDDGIWEDKDEGKLDNERSYPGQRFHNNSISKPRNPVDVEDRKRGGIDTSKIMHDKQSRKKIEDDGIWEDTDEGKLDNERSYPGQRFHNNSLSKPRNPVDVEDRKRGGINTFKIMHGKQSRKKVEDDGIWGDPDDGIWEDTDEGKLDNERSYPGQRFHNNSLSKPRNPVDVEDRKRGGINTSKIMHGRQSRKKVKDDGIWDDKKEGKFEGQDIQESKNLKIGYNWDITEAKNEQVWNDRVLNNLKHKNNKLDKCEKDYKAVISQHIGQTLTTLECGEKRDEKARGKQVMNQSDLKVENEGSLKNSKAEVAYVTVKKDEVTKIDEKIEEPTGIMSVPSEINEDPQKLEAENPKMNYSEIEVKHEEKFTNKEAEDNISIITKSQDPICILSVPSEINENPKKLETEKPILSHSEMKVKNDDSLRKIKAEDDSSVIILAEDPTGIISVPSEINDPEKLEAEKQNMNCSKIEVKQEERFTNIEAEDGISIITKAQDPINENSKKLETEKEILSHSEMKVKNEESLRKIKAKDSSSTIILAEDPTSIMSLPSEKNEDPKKLEAEKLNMNYSEIELKHEEKFTNIEAEDGISIITKSQDPICILSVPSEIKENSKKLETEKQILSHSEMKVKNEDSLRKNEAEDGSYAIILAEDPTGIMSVPSEINEDPKKFEKKEKKYEQKSRI